MFQIVVDHTWEEHLHKQLQTECLDGAPVEEVDRLCKISEAAIRSAERNTSQARGPILQPCSAKSSLSLSSHLHIVQR